MHDPGYLLQLAGANLAAERLQDARSIYENILAINPCHPEAHFGLGQIEFKQSNLMRALDHFRQAVSFDPMHIGYLERYADTLVAAGKPDDARKVIANARKKGLSALACNDLLASLKKHPSKSSTIRATPTTAELGEIEQFIAQGDFDAALRFANTLIHRYPKSGEALFQYAKVLLALRRQTDAIDALTKAATLRPAHADTALLLAKTLCSEMRFDAAIPLLRRALKHHPKILETYYTLAYAHYRTGQFGDALSVLSRAPGPGQHVDFTMLQALCYIAMGNVAKAITAYRSVTDRYPSFAPAFSMLGKALRLTGDTADAARNLEYACELDPNDPMGFVHLGEFYRELAQYDKAVANLQIATKLVPNDIGLLEKLGLALQGDGQANRAAACLQQVLQNDQNNDALECSVALALASTGQLAKAIQCLRNVLDRSPEHLEANQHLLFYLMHDPETTPDQLYLAHRAFGERFDTPQSKNRAAPSARESSKPLRIGLVSGDLCRHASTNFLEPLLRVLKDDRRVCLTAYYNRPYLDDIALRHQAYFGQWHNIVDLDDAAVATLVRQDRIDVLIDLHGHTGRNRLLVFAQRPARVQCSWIGYPGTTGMRSIDYFIGDNELVPKELERLFSEKILRLPAMAPFDSYSNPPSPSPLPALTLGHRTFGSFARPMKINRKTAELWASLMARVPQSRLLVASRPKDAVEDTIFLDWMDCAGITRDRIRFAALCSSEDYFALHREVDICLDTIPYTGATTTHQALLIGVPTLTLNGETPAGRHGASILFQTGLTEWIATSPADFVERGARLASDLGALSTLRAQLPQRCRAAPLRDPVLIANSLVDQLLAL